MWKLEINMTLKKISLHQFQKTLAVISTLIWGKATSGDVEKEELIAEHCQCRPPTIFSEKKAEKVGFFSKNSCKKRRKNQRKSYKKVESYEKKKVKTTKNVFC